MSSPIVHFEIPADDTERAAKFYTELFGWEIKKTPMEGMEYWSVMTKPTDDGPGINGGLMKRKMPGQAMVNYASVASLEESLKKAEELGAQVLVPKTPVPTMGYFAIVMDTEKNPVGIWQDDKSAA